VKIDAETGAAFARIALGHVTREYPHKLDQVLVGDADLAPPRLLHPIFYGSFDWHSCVHGWWSLLTLRRLFPDNAEAADIAALADASFTAEKVAAERAYLDRPMSAGFERPYGWGWLLYLHLEASRHDDRAWAAALEPLAHAFADRFKAYLPKLTYPIRVGTHFNTAFALTLALEWAERFDDMLADAICEWVIDRFGRDRDCQAWEPGGDEFLSPALIEALCMSRVLPSEPFDEWFGDFLPRIAAGEPRTLFVPATVSDRSDGKIAHLDGLNLSRAWCWRSLGFPEHAEQHLESALPHLAENYMGEHWLVSFALLALITEPKR
jgi:Protein of unknown function (DUF2891)